MPRHGRSRPKKCVQDQSLCLHVPGISLPDSCPCHCTCLSALTSPSPPLLTSESSLPFPALYSQIQAPFPFLTLFLFLTCHTLSLLCLPSSLPRSSLHLWVTPSLLTSQSLRQGPSHDILCPGLPSPSSSFWWQPWAGEAAGRAPWARVLSSAGRSWKNTAS